MNREPAVIVVGSGKGGVGKSVLSVMLAWTAAARGRRVLLVDGDENLANLHLLLGIRPAARHDAVLYGAVAPPDLLRPIAENLWLLPGDSGAETLQALGAVDRARLSHQLSTVYDEFDLVIVDAGAGIDSVVRAASLRASRLVVVTMPEPAALADAYALMKLVHLQLPTLPLDLLVNRCESAEEGRAVFDRLASACERFLRRGVRFLGAVPEDEAVRQAVRDPARCLARLAASDAARTLREGVLDRIELPESIQSMG